VTIKTRSETRQVGPLSMRAEVTSIDVEKRTFEVMWSTGAKVLRSSWYSGDFYEELSMDPAHIRMGRLTSGTAPFLLNHDGYNVAEVPGVIESARLAGGKGYAKVRMVSEGIDPQADLVFKKIVDKVIRNVSVGYRTFKAEKTDGVDTKIPTIRAVDWEPHEISMVAMGAEQGAGVRSAAVETHEVQIIHRGESSTTEEQDLKNKRKFQEPNDGNGGGGGTPVPAPVPTEAQIQKRIDEAATRAVELERTRVDGIRHAVKTAKLGDAVEKKLIDEKTSLDAARAFVLEELAKRDLATPTENATRVTGVEGQDADSKWIRAATAGQLARSGSLPAIVAMLAAHEKRDARHQNPDLVAAFKDFDPKDNGGEFRSFSLLDLAAESLERRGVKTRGMSKEKMLQRAIDFARDNGGQNTSSDFSVALENLMHKALLGEYAQQQDTWRRFCGVDSVPDFRTSNRYRLGSFGVLDTLEESGEYKQKQIPDAIKQTISTETRGNKIALSRKAIINDDMGAVMASAQRFGRMAGLTIEKAVYDLLAENAGLGPTITYNGITAALFDAQFANIGTGAAISVDSLYADMVTMASQVDISNNEKLDIRPNVLLLPLALGGKAKQFNRDTYDPTAGSAFQASNKVANMFRDIIDTPRLSGTRRYTFSDQTPALLVVFLNGSQVPVMEQRPGWDIDGIEWKIRLDVAAQGFDPKGAVTNAGT
jgi:hypothetical protein